jgi:hypothetical protein
MAAINRSVTNAELDTAPGRAWGPGIANDLREKTLKYRRLCWSAAIITALAQALAYRHQLTPDGMSYLDIARSWSQGNWHALVNGYWSPLYPFLLGVVFRIVKPSPGFEVTLAHLVNFGIFVLSFAAFEFLLKMLIRVRQKEGPSTDGREPIPEWALWALGDSLCAWSALLFVQLGGVYPDLCVVALIYLAAGLLLRIRADQGGWIAYACLGTVLGMAYLAKAAMFPLAFAFLGCGLFAVRSLRKTVPLTTIAIVFFMIVGSPFVLSLSRSKARFTYGDVGKIAYAEFVDGAARYIHWQGGPSGTGTPIHPTRIVFDHPAIFEFAAPIEGSYPPWYDPSYWYDGIVAKIQLGNQLRAVRYTIEEYVGIVAYMGGLFVGFLGMALLARQYGSVWKDVLHEWVLWAPALAALGIYGLVYVESRHVAGFFVLVWLSLFAGLRVPRTEVAQLQVKYLTIATVLMLSVGIAWLAGRSAYRAVHPEPFVNLLVAEGLHNEGIQPGDRVASIGDSLNGYWAHLAGARIIAEIPLAEIADFSEADTDRQIGVMSVFSRAGAKAVVIDRTPPANAPAGWRQIDGTNYFVYDLAHATALKDAAGR